MPELRRSARVAARPAKEPEAVTEQPPTKKVKTAPTNTAKPDAGLGLVKNSRCYFVEPRW